MLRSSGNDLLMSLECQGNGTMQVDGQPGNVSKYRTSISYQTSGERIQITGTRPNGQSCSNVEVLSGAYAWNEHSRCRTHRARASHPDARNRRTDDSPVGKPAGCVQGRIRRDVGPTCNDPQTATATSRCHDGAKRPSRVGNKPVLTFPIPGVPNATATATLDAKFMAEAS
jgi:hypothetical protein